MIVINAHDGVEVEAGEWFVHPSGNDDKLREIKPGVFLGRSYRAQLLCLGVVRETLFSATLLVEDERGRRRELPLEVRWMHPGSFLKKVGLIRS